MAGSVTSGRRSRSFVLGLVIEKVTGHPLGEELNARIFRPLGLDQHQHRLGLPHPAQGEALNALLDVAYCG
jgi:CubicO group peptidase (beta-lactamase class C family)